MERYIRLKDNKIKYQFRLLQLCIFLILCLRLDAQKETVISRAIFIGGTGTQEDERLKIVAAAADNVIAGKTSAFFLGDNIPDGMGLDGEKELKSQAVLQSLFEPMRKSGAAVYFLPGEQEWDNAGPDGLVKIKKLSDYLTDQNDSLLHILPSNGCPDPVVISLSDSVVVIAMDSEWWLYPYDKNNDGADCGCSSTRDVTIALRELAYKNRTKTIVLLTHHPFQSYGTHGGYFSLKNHIFPFTAFSNKLYLPLPLVGSVYPLLRKTFAETQDLHHPLYQSMSKDVDNVFASVPNYIQVSGHEHGLQLIDDSLGQRMQVVSGGGQSGYVSKGKNMLWGSGQPGFVIADILPAGQVRFTFYTLQQGVYKADYVYLRQPRVDKNISEDSSNVAQDAIRDSAVAVVRPEYAQVSGAHRFLFGRNYRKEWATAVKLPVFNMSEIYGGLRPEKLGGGYQSTSLRLADPKGKEYTLRLVQKSVDRVVPGPFSGTFVNSWLDDATSAQHPYSALSVPPIANAIGVPHATPRVGIVTPSKALGMYNGLYDGKIALLEEREPLGNSDNSEKALKKLQEDNDNTFDALNFSKARMLDLLLGDWDRHADQWRFYNTNSGKKDKHYLIVPRDRDMVFNKTEGLIPDLVKHLLLMPHVPGFKENMLPGSNYYFYKSSFLNAHPASQMSYDTWMSLARNIQQKLTDSVLETAIRQMPSAIYKIRYDELKNALRQRRDDLVLAADKYYRFAHQIVDIHLSDKNESVQVQDIAGQDALRLMVRKINKHGALKDTLMDVVYPHPVTREIRLYLSKGDDSVFVNNANATVKLRIIGGNGDKVYNIQSANKTIAVYDRKKETYTGQYAGKLKLHIRKDSANTAFQPTNLYDTYLPLVNGRYNSDDGIFLGLGVQWKHQKGFRKSPYTSLQQIILSHSFATKAFNIDYTGEWIHAIGNADFVFDASIKAPDNTQNFFGSGNESSFDKTGDYVSYYRTRFNLIDVQPALRWRFRQNAFVRIGPAFQYYHLDQTENTGRFINNTDRINSYDSSTVFEDKYHVGIAAEYSYDGRDNSVLPTWGYYFYVRMKGMKGVNNVAKNFAQLEPVISVYKSLNNRQTLVLADRVGGGLTVGKSAFYQSLFLGSEGNLLGYRKYRFAGKYSLYNNLEVRCALADFGNYLFKGQFGLLAFYDVGRVWTENENSNKWHNSVGGGAYVAPAKLAVFRFTMGYTPEGWYPSFGMGFRF